MRELLVLTVLVLFPLLTLSSEWKIRENNGANGVDSNNPVADPKAIVLFGNARFTVLTSQLIRLEYSSNGKFVDEASLVFINRRLPVPSFTSKENGNTLVINTGTLELVYNKGISGFAANNINITFPFKGSHTTWVPGLKNTGNLMGTRTSLDCYTTSCQDGMPLDPGLLSTLGWVLFDDSSTPLFNYSNTDGIPWITMPNQRNGGNKGGIDWYFFGYGLSFTQSLFDYSTLSGPIAIPPTSAFGSWWSRYYPYTQTTIIDQIIDGYRNNSLPLNHLVLDMDWHIEVNDKQCNTWGGYTWNTAYFPNPPSFIDYLHSPPNDLRLLLNIHPQTGVDVCQAKYHALANAIDFDTRANATIPCDFMSHTMATNMFSVVMDVVGADYWWTDYNGCHDKEDIDTTEYDLLWSNHVFYYEHATKNQRPLTLSRYGGPGNQRYPVGFSGDTYDVFPTLQFEIYFTHTAANILFGYWSHDTGGFHNEPSDELFLRWLQFAAVEPIFRIHSDHQERRIWVFPSFELMKDAMLLRNALGPYIYSQARRAYDTAVSIVHPLYYDFPTYPQAYSYIYQYKFGDDMLAAPVVTPVSPSTNTTTKPIWIPPGTWIHYFSLKSYTGPLEFNMTVGLPDLPLFVKAGAIIPLKTMASVTNYTPDPLLFAVYPGATQGNTTYYEDDGATMGYLNGQYSFTTVSYSVQGTSTKIIISATVGTFEGQPKSRSYQTILKGANTPKSVSVNGSPLGPSKGTQPGWWVDSVLQGLVVLPQQVAITTEVVIVVVF